ncbi:MAG: BlaI/MecI/CopY family transcriptional regulator [Verrucomicrobiaceae bacterium]|nr:BlaI/MecI/CopY family transcriptional regulator [Verrucomicrobiaceae bacterium]
MKDPLPHLSRREREIMDIVFAAREATVADIEARMANPPTRPALRSLVTILENKGHLTHTKRGREFVYQPAHKPESVGRSALGRVLKTFFDGSVTQALASFLSDPKARISQSELDDLADFVAKAKATQPPRKTKS